jgi:hypothetical protein
VGDRSGEVWVGVVSSGIVGVMYRGGVVGRCAEAESHVCVCVSACVRASVRPNPEMFTYSGNCTVLFPSRRENKEYCLSNSTSLTFLTQDNVLVSLHVFVFVLIVHCFHSRCCLLFLARACVCVLRKYWSLSWVIRMSHIL